MKYGDKDLTDDLKGRIKKIESEINELVHVLLEEHKPKLAKKDLHFEAELDRTGDDPFIPGYGSSITTAIFDEVEEYLELYNIPIWKCNRYFLGMPISKKIPGSKIVGELFEESIEDIKLELNEYILEQLSVTED